MLDFSRVQNYYIACGYTDMRKQIDGLAAVVELQFGRKLDEVSIFLFCIWPGGGSPQYLNDRNCIAVCSPTTQAALDPYMDFVLYAEPLFDTDVNERLLILDTDITTYMKSCAAKFIRGEMSFDEWDTYCSTLESMGLQEWVGIYQERLDTYQ